MKNENNALTLLAARNYSYRFFQSVFGGEPTKEQIGVWASRITEDSFLIMPSDEDSGYSIALSSVLEILVSAVNEPESYLTKLRQEYTDLFIGPHALPAPPWESVYLSRERALFLEDTLTIRNLYRAEGLIPKEYPLVADDHLSLEIAFMSSLAENALGAYMENCKDIQHHKLQVSKSFLVDHLTIWIPLFTKLLQQQKTTVFYTQAAILLEKFLELDLAVVDHLLSID